MNDEFSNIMNRLSENARFALQKADFYSKKYNNGYTGTEHLLLGMLAQDSSTAAKILYLLDVNLETVEAKMNQPAKDVVGGQMAMMSLSEAVVLTLRMAAAVATEYDRKIIGTEHILYAILNQTNSAGAVMLEKNGVELKELTEDVANFLQRQATMEKIEEEREKLEKKPKLRWLVRYGENLTKLAEEGKLDRVIGREKEIERMAVILARRNKSNPVLIGEAGVGKTAIVEGLALKIANSEVPSVLLGKQIYQIDLARMVAGTKYRGEFEERIKGVIDETLENEDIILFLDEMHLLTGAGESEGSVDAANILKPALSRGKLKMIGATTLDEYRKEIEKDKALERRFQVILVEEPSDEIIVKILKGIKPYYEKHHQVIIPDEIFQPAINMAKRYINDRYAPDKIVDVIDEAAAMARVEEDKKSGFEYRKLFMEKRYLEQQIAKLMEAQLEFENDLAMKEIGEKKPIRSEVETMAHYQKIAELKTELARIEKEIKSKKPKQNKKIKLTEENVAKAVAVKTGIPITKIHDSEQKLLVGLEDHLKKYIIGQDEAIEKVAKVIRRGRSGIANAKRPIGSFLLLGPTGVGKTELARTLAKEVFGGENALIKIDMSEFGEKHSASRLVGAPAGYVGYEDGGKLTEAVRRKPYAVVLFDEIEKADPEVFNLLLQVLEDGILTDTHGNKVKFNNTIIIMTSNLGSGYKINGEEMGFGKKTEFNQEKAHEANKAAAMKALEKKMKPELINRLDHILVFRPLTKEVVAKIAENMLSDFEVRLASKALGMVLEKEAKNWLVERGFDEKNGARPLRREIENSLETLFADAIIAGELKPGDIARVGIKGDKLGFITEAKVKQKEMVKDIKERKEKGLSKSKKNKAKMKLNNNKEEKNEKLFSANSDRRD